MALFSKQALNQMEAEQDATPARQCVMIVDDREANLAVMAAILRPHYTLLEAHDGQEALNMIGALEERDSLACIVSDYRMPGINGVELLERARPLLPFSSRVIVSGFIDLDAIIDAINKAEIHKFIAKPFEAGELLSGVESAVANYLAARAAATREAELARQVAGLAEQLEALRARI